MDDQHGVVNEVSATMTPEQIAELQRWFDGWTINWGGKAKCQRHDSRTDR